MAHVNLSHQPEQDWASYWRSRPLPILQVSKQALQAMARRADRVRVEDVAEVVLADPLLTLSVLRYMGQRPRSSLAAEVVSVQGIVMLMGVLPFLERFQSLSTVESILSEHQEDYAAYLQCIFQSRFSARLAMLYADWRYDARLDEIQVASLLSYSNDLLRILGKQIDKNLPEVPTQVTSLLTRLKVPNVIIQLLGEVENAPIRIQLLAAVLRLVKAFQTGWWQVAVQKELALIAGMLNIELEIVWGGLCKLTLQCANDPSISPLVQQPACYLPMLPGEWQSSNSVTSAQKAMVLPMLSVPSPANKAESTVLAQAKDDLTSYLQALQAVTRQGVASKDILAATMRALSDGLQMRRLVFCMWLPAKQELQTRFTQGVAADHPLRQLTLRINEAGVFNKLLQKPQSIWVNQNNRAQFVAHLPNKFKTTFVSEDFFAMSIFIGNKPLGLIWVDQLGQAGLTEAQYQGFKQICLMTTRALTKSVAV